MKCVVLTLKKLSLFAAATMLLSADVRAAVTFTITPATVSNTYSGNIVLNISGLSAGATVMVQKYIDGNTNSAIDAADWLVQRFPLTDGQVSMIGGVTNINIPGDYDPAAGTIRANLNLQAGGLGQRFVGAYAVRLSSPTGQFGAITNLLRITNSAFAQSLTGNVRCNGTNVPNASVLIFPGQSANSDPIGGVVANNSGSYTLKAAPGTYGLLPFKPGLVTDAAASPTVTLNAGATLSTNLTLLPATRSISGRFVDDGDPGLGLAGILVVCESMDGHLAISFTDANGNFTVPVTPGQWRVSLDSASLPTVGYLDSDNNPEVDTTTGNVTGVTFAFPKGTALINGSVKDDQNRPLAGVGLWASESVFHQSEGMGTTDQDGNYVAAVTAGSWHIEVDNSSPGLANYVVSQGSDVSINQGQAIRVDFRALLATNHIAGYVRDNSGNPVAGVGVYCWANISGTTYGHYSDTDPGGYYSLNVANGSWNVGLSCGDGDDSLSSHGYQCVNEQQFTIANNNGAIDFTVVPCTSLQVSTTSLPSAQQNTFYSLQLQASGCYQPFNWSLAPGSQSLPNGLNLFSDGTLQGTPYVSGTYTFTVRVTDNGGGWADRTLSLTIDNPGPPLQITTVSLPTATQNIFYNQQFTASGGQPPYSWSRAPGSQFPPQNLILGSNGELSGSPIQSGTFSFTVRVTDNNNVWADQTFWLTVNPQLPPLQITSGFLPNGTQNSPYNQQLTASGGQPPYNWWLPGGTATLPPGTMNLSSAGVLSGVPNAPGTYNFWVGVYDSATPQNLVTQMVSLTINLSTPLQVTTTFLPNGTASVSYSQQLNASGGQQPYTWSLAPGSADLPGGLSLAANGLISGTPTNGGTFFFFVRVTDAGTTTADQFLSLTIDNPPLQVTTVALPNATLNGLYSTQLGATGGQPPYTWSLALGSANLPAGLSLSTGGLISGTPTTSGQFNFIARVTDANFVSVNRPLAIQVSSRPSLGLASRPSASQFQFRINGVSGQAYTIQVSTNLVSWDTALVTNAPSDSFDVRLNSPAGSRVFYRLLVGP